MIKNGNIYSLKSNTTIAPLRGKALEHFQKLTQVEYKLEYLLKEN